MFAGKKAAIAICLIALPLAVAIFDLSFWLTLLLVIALLAWTWLDQLSGVFRRGGGPALVLDTVSMSHFAEKARWCMDRLGVDYRENKSNGLLGVVLTGRTVPRLRLRTGAVESSIGHSPEILRFLWGEYGARLETAAFLEPTEEALELEAKIDRYGVDLQVWVYYHLLPHKETTLHIWGAEDTGIPKWQRTVARPLYTLLAKFLRRTFGIDGAHYNKAVEHVDAMLAAAEERLQGGKQYLLGDAISFVDITFASLSGLWLQPDNYGGGQANDCKVAIDELPDAMQADRDRWREKFPAATAFIERLYAEERFT